MQKYLTKDDTVNSIRFQLNHPHPQNKLWCIVEGTDDIKIFRKFFDINVELEEISGGCENIELAIVELNKLTKQVFAIRDADFLHIYPQSTTIDNLFISDCHDMELQIIKSNEVFIALISEFFSEQIDVYDDFRNNIFKTLAFLSLIRLWNFNNNRQLNFRGIRIGSFINANSFSIDKDKCIEYINNRSPNKKQSLSLTDIEAMDLGEYDLFQLTNGHDFITFLVLYATSGIPTKTISSSLRTAYSFTRFQESNLYNNLNSWATENEKHIFRSACA